MPENNAPVWSGKIVKTNLEPEGFLVFPMDMSSQMGRECPPGYESHWITLVSYEMGTEKRLGEDETVTRIGWVEGQRGSEVQSQ